MAPDRLSGTSGGVFVGICGIDYSKRITRRDPALIDAYIGTGNSHSVAAGRLSYFFGLQGPSVAIDTACSSSLVALHWACQCLRGRECSFALAGGVNLLLDPELSINFSKAHMLSPSGRCQTFDASADGYVRGEGAAMIVLKRLSDALAANDRIYALVRGSAINQDGPSSGLTVPNGPSQQDVIRRALAMASLQPEEVDYLEAHGTGTSLGDPIEMIALGEVFRGRSEPLRVGSVKTNIGHLEATAGVAGVLKVILALQQQQIPPHLHFRQPSPRIPWNELPLRVPTQLEPWPRGCRPRRAGVSAFAFNGTNAHVVLEESPLPDEDPRPERPCHLLTLSAKTPEALRELAGSYASRLGTEPLRWSDICYTASKGRSHCTHRLALRAETVTEARQHLQGFLDGNSCPEVVCGEVESESPSVAFLFSGQGAQYTGMGWQLRHTEPTFRAAMEQCEQILRDHLDRPLREILAPEAGSPVAIDETIYAQPSLFALEYSLSRMWQHWGVCPAAMIGHSVGEYAAACLAGVFSLEDGLKLIAARGRLMQELPRNGLMAAVFAEEGQVRESLAGLAEQVDIAAVNGPRQVVISGLAAAVEEALTRLERAGIAAKKLARLARLPFPLDGTDARGFPQGGRDRRVPPAADQADFESHGRCGERPDRGAGVLGAARAEDGPFCRRDRGAGRRRDRRRLGDRPAVDPGKPRSGVLAVGRGPTRPAVAEQSPSRQAGLALRARVPGGAVCAWAGCGLDRVRYGILRSDRDAAHLSLPARALLARAGGVAGVPAATRERPRLSIRCWDAGSTRRWLETRSSLKAG